MKIVIKAEKPRAKWLHDLLSTKRSEKHLDVRTPSREKQKQRLNREIAAYIMEDKSWQ